MTTPSPAAAETTADVPMFDVDQPPVPKVRKPIRDVAAQQPRPKWLRYSPVRQLKCDDCMTVLAQNDGHGPAARAAYFRRVAADGTDLLLCEEHAQDRRDDDGFDGLGRLKETR